MSFLDQFRNREGRIDVDALSKFVVEHDRFDLDDFVRLQAEMKEFSAAEDRLSDAANTGSHAFADDFFALLKANPTIMDKGKVMPSYRLNQWVIEEAMKLKEYQELRMYSVNDMVASALATIAMEPDLEILFDKLKQLQEEVEQLEQLIRAAAAAEGEDEGEGEGEGEGVDADAPPEDGEEPVDYNALVAQAEAELEEKLAAAGPELRNDLRNAFRDAIEEAEATDMAGQMWGMEPGQLRRLDASKRIELAQKMRSDRIRKLAKLFGAMVRMAFAERAKRTIHSRDEIFDIERGNDLARLLPIELISLQDEALEMDFYRRFYEGQLLQYRLRGTEKLARGGIIFCEDGSGSMTGERELWAKAVSLVLLQIARSQKRPFYGIHFGSRNEMSCYDFRDTTRIDPQNVMDWAEVHFGGGTDFVTPLSQALKLMQEEFAATGATKADVVFCTDGMCSVPPEFIEMYHAEQERIGFRTYGLIIGGHPQSEPLYTICNQRVVSIKKLTTGDDMRSVFAAL